MKSKLLKVSSLSNCPDLRIFSPLELMLCIPTKSNYFISSGSSFLNTFKYIFLTFDFNKIYHLIMNRLTLEQRFQIVEIYF